MTNGANDSLRNQIYENMRVKDTDELLEIWRFGDHKKWTDTAFEIVKELLLERLGNIPAQEPETIDVETTSAENENEPYFDENKLLKISTWANTLSWVILALYLIGFLGRVVLEVQGMFQGRAQGLPLYLLIDTPQIFSWFGLLTTPAVGIMDFLVLQTISEGILGLIGVNDNGIVLLNILKTKKKKDV